MHLQLPHCIERLVKTGRVIHIEYSKNHVKIRYDADVSKNIIPFGQRRLNEYGDDNNG